MFRFLIAVIFVFATNTAFSASCIELAVEKCINLGDPQRCIAQYRAEYCGGSAISESAAPEPEVPDLSPAKSGISLRLEASASDIAAQEQTAPAPDVAAPSSETYEQDGKAFTIKGFKKTRFGVLKIVEEEDSGTTDIVLDSKSVFPKSSQSNEPTSCYYSIVDLFQMDNTDVALAHESCFGMSRDLYGYFFITIDVDKNTTISDSFPMAGDSANLVGNKIIIDNINIVDDSEIEDNPSTNIAKNTVGEDILFRKVVYENGKVTIEKSSVNLQDKTKSCQNLYDVYKQYVEEDCGTNNPYDEVCSVGGMATSRGCGDYLDFDTKLAKEAKSACQSRRIMGFAGFKQKVCGLKNDPLKIADDDLELSKELAKCTAQFSISIRLGKQQHFTKRQLNIIKTTMDQYSYYATALTNQDIVERNIKSALDVLNVEASHLTKGGGDFKPYWDKATRSLDECSALLDANFKRIKDL